jgi:hypothetical protein
MHYPVLYYVLYLCGVKLYRARGAPLQLESLMVVSGVQYRGRRIFLHFPYNQPSIGLSPNRSYLGLRL